MAAFRRSSSQQLQGLEAPAPEEEQAGERGRPAFGLLPDQLGPVVALKPDGLNKAPDLVRPNHA
jgi:hypothetical protein